ncbi:MAG: M67 family metallopeptidase [Sneathiella sp.]
MHLFLTPEHYENLTLHASECWPEEACALLVGSEDKMGNRTLSRAVLSKNIAMDPRRYFEVDPAVRIALEKELRGASDTLIGVFHTHPDGEPIPSQTDEQRIYEKQLSWLIAASNKQGIRSMEAYHPRHDAGFDKIQMTIRKKEAR